MKDLVFVAVIIAFFALSALYVTWCDRIIGPDDFAADTPSGSAGDPALTGSAPESAEVSA